MILTQWDRAVHLWWLCVLRQGWAGLVSVGKSCREASRVNNSALWVVGFVTRWLNLLIHSADWCWLGSQQTGPLYNVSHTTCPTHVFVFILLTLSSLLHLFSLHYSATLDILSCSFSPVHSFFYPSSLLPSPLSSCCFSAGTVSNDYSSWRAEPQPLCPSCLLCRSLCVAMCTCMSHRLVRGQCVTPSRVKWVMNKWLYNSIWARSICRGWIFKSL